MAEQAEQQSFSFFEDIEVHDYRVKLKIPANSLSPSMASDKEIHLFDKVYILLEADATRIGFDGDPDSETAVRVTDLKADVACIVPANFAKSRIDAQRKRDLAHAEEIAELKREEREERAAERKAERARFKIMQSDDEPDDEPPDEPDDEPF